MVLPHQDKSAFETNLNAKINKISGLNYIPNYIKQDSQNRLMEIIDQQKWSIKTNRRIQEYGYKYDYKDGSFAASIYLGFLPSWAQNLAKRLAEDGFMANVPDQLIVNEYEPGQGIVSHIDCIPCFGNTIITLSLGSDCVMNFIHAQTQEVVEILLQPGSLLIFHQEARYRWKHGIIACERDSYQGQEFLRMRRVSLTFREVLFPYK